MKLLSQIVKWTSIVIGAGSQLTPFIPEAWAGWAILAFGIASAVKDKVLLPIGDQLDDGKLNNSYKG